MKIECAHDKVVPVEQLTPNPRNPNQHPKAQIKLLAKIINHQGWRSPIVVSNRSGFVVKGHGRLEAAQLNKYTEVPVDYQDYESEALEHADMVADNRISELSDLDDKAIRDLIVEVSNDFDFELFAIDKDLFINVEEINRGDENAEWVDMPEFKEAEKEIKLTIFFNTEIQRQLFVENKQVEITKKQNNQWISRI